MRPESCGKDSSWRSPLKSEPEGASVTIVPQAWGLLDQGRSQWELWVAGPARGWSACPRARGAVGTGPEGLVGNPAGRPGLLCRLWFPFLRKPSFGEDMFAPSERTPASRTCRGRPGRARRLALGEDRGRVPAAPCPSRTEGAGCMPSCWRTSGAGRRALTPAGVCSPRARRCSEQRAHGDAQAREPFAREGSGVPRGWGRARCVPAHTHFVEVGKYLSPARLASTTQRIVTKFDFVGTRALKAWSVLAPAKMLCP